MNIQSAYENWLSTYDHDRNLTRDLDQATMRKVFADTHYRNILELGCGTGKNTVLLAEISEAVRALDFSEGGKANFQHGDKIIQVPAYVHHASEFLQAASQNNFRLESFNEHWHQDDQGKPPRLAAFMFKKQ